MRGLACQLTVAWLWLLAGLVASNSNIIGQKHICMVYLTGQHDVIPSDPELIKPITHVALAFMRSEVFLGKADPDRTDWPIFRSVASTREAFAPGTKIMIAIGGWGDTGFSEAARNHTSRKAFAQNVAFMVGATGADGVDIDWEYPGGNGEDYKQVPNSEKEWEIEAYPLLLAELAQQMGRNKTMTAAVPGLERDMAAFTRSTMPRIMLHLDFINVMSYDLVNRRDNVTKHHSSLRGSRDALQAYISRGVPPERMNLGLGFYVKWFKTDKEDCATAKTPLGCKTLLLEDPVTGADLGRAGAFSWHDAVPKDLKESFQRALDDKQYDVDEGATYYWDPEQAIWWTFDFGNPSRDIDRKARGLRDEMRLAGVFAWGLGEDAPGFSRLASLVEAFNDTSATDPEFRDRDRDRDEL